MTINVTTLLNCVNNSIAAADTTNPLEILQLASAVKDFDAGFVYSVANEASLPPAADNAGRLAYLLDQSKYVVSDGSVWTSDFSSEPPESSIWAWGNNDHGQLGDYTITSRLSPVSVVGGFTDWCQVSARGGHSLGLRSNGTVWSWGLGTCGRLGDGNEITRSSPVSVIGGFSDWCQVSAGGFHSLGLRSNGTVWAWGSNTYGKLGDGTPFTNRSSPVSVVGGFTDWCQVSAGFVHSIALRTDGTAWAWGVGTFGQLGTGTTTTRSSPVSVVGGFTDWCQVSAGGYYSLGIRSNGTAWAWGLNNQGRLGDGTTANRSSPVSVVGGFTDWCQVSAGGYYSLGIRSNGTAWAWGSNSFGAIGDGTTANRSSPVSVVGGFTDWCQVSAGGDYSIAVRSNGTAWAWGANYGKLGDGTDINRSSPVSVVGGFTDWCYVSGGAAIRQCPIVKGF